jgi:hypothetical protein
MYSTKPTYQQARASASWLWRLPKALCAATKGEEVLEAWVKFRYKSPKALYHSMLALKRLNQVGGIDPGDWRMQLIFAHLKVKMDRADVVMLPRVARFYANLGALRELDGMLRFLDPHLHRYSATQLLDIAKALAKVRVREPRLLFAVAERARKPMVSGVRPFAGVSAADVGAWPSCFAACDLDHPALFAQCSAELQRRHTDVDLDSGEEVPLEALVRCGEAFARAGFPTSASWSSLRAGSLI